MEDLDVIMEKPHQIKIFGRVVDFKPVTVKEHLHNEYLVKEIEQLPFITEADAEKASDMIVEYIMKVLDVKKEEASKVTMAQYKALRKYMGRIEMYDQGFSDREIDKLEKKLVKEQMKAIK